MPALAVMLVAAAAAFRPDARELFAGCRLSDPLPQARLYQCQGWAASLATHRLKPDPARMLDHARALGRMGLPRAVEERAILKLADREVPYLRFVPPAGEKGEAFVVRNILAIEHGPQAYRLATCSVHSRRLAATDRCERVLRYLAERGVPEDVDIDGDPDVVTKPMLLSRRLSVPAGCRVATSTPQLGQIECTGSALFWSAAPMDARPPGAFLDEAVKLVSSRLGGSVTDERISCTIERIAGRCARLTREIFGRKLVTCIGVANIQHHWVTVQCAFMDEGSGFPPVCNGILAVP